MDNKKQFRLSGGGGGEKRNRFKNFGFLALLILFALVIYTAFNQPSQLKEVPFSQLVTEANSGNIQKIQVNGNELLITPKGQSKPTEKSFKEEGSSIYQQGLEQGKVEIVNKPGSSGGSFWVQLAINLLPVIIIAAILIFMFRSAQGQGNQALSFGKSRARLYGNEKDKITFKDVAGNDESKQDLQEVVEFLKYPKKFEGVGARIPKGVLLVGPAGTGKTLLARAVAGEANVPFYSMSGSEFMEMLVGVGAARVRDLFETAKKNSPSIIFIDEIESIGRQRGGAMTGGHEEREQTLNQILTEMDGFTPTDNVIVLAATNRPELLDPALTRPGRFDRHVVLDLPDIEGRKDIFKIHMRGKPMGPDVDLYKITKRTVGFSGADIENMLNEAAILAATLNKKAVGMPDLEEAATRVKLGPEKKRLQSPEERRMTAYHEAGHAIVASQLPHMDPVHRVSIVSRGLALGFTEIPPATDRYHHTKTELLERVTSLLGGRAAEEVIFKEFSAGASSDLAQATMIVRKMVMELGMSILGPISLASGEMEWYGVSHEQGNFISEEMAGKVDREVVKILGEAYAQAKKVLEKNLPRMEKVTDALLEKETLDEEEFRKLVG